MISFLESVAIIQLNSPTFLAIRALNVVRASWLAVCSSINLRNTAAETKLRFEVIGQRRAVKDLLAVINGSIRILKVVQSRAVELSFTAEAEFTTAKPITRTSSITDTTSLRSGIKFEMDRILIW